MTATMTAGLDQQTPELDLAAVGVHVAVLPVGRALTVGSPLPEEAAFAATLPRDRAAEHRASRGLLRAVLARIGDADAARAPLAATRRGQPYLPDLPFLSVSLSHSDGWVAVAVGVHRPVGIDVQVPVPVEPGMIRRCCSPRLADVLAALPESRRAGEFAWIWTVQEACVKAAGTGLGGCPWRIPVPRRPRSGTWNGYRWRTIDGFGVPVSCAYGEVIR